MTPFVGRNFNVTRAGIHADGLLKNEEIYNIFDTAKFLKRPPVAAVSNTSGLAGIALWINAHYGLIGEHALDKRDPLVGQIKTRVDREYADGRVTVMTDEEMTEMTEEECRTLGIPLPQPGGTAST